MLRGCSLPTMMTSSVVAVKRRLAFQSRADDSGQVRYHCGVCDRYLEEVAFIPSSIRLRSPVCRQCRRDMKYELRHRSPDDEAAVALYAMEHTRFGRQGQIPLSFVTSALDAAHRRSAISGAKDRLRLRRFWADLPLSLENVVVVTADENRILGRKKRWLELFPADLVARMTAWRDAQLAAAAAQPPPPGEQ